MNCNDNINNTGTAGSLLLIGGGGHALSVFEALHESESLHKTYSKIAVIDSDDEKIGSSLIMYPIIRTENSDAQRTSIPIIGTDYDLKDLRGEYSHAFISLGSIGDWHRRERLYMLASAYDYSFPNIIHPSACLSSFSEYAFGIFAGMGVCVNAGCTIAEMCILNTRCVVEHGCTVGKYAHIAPGAVLCGNVNVGVGAHVGAGSVVIQGITVGENTIIGAGSVVVRDIPANAVAYGNPCRVVRKKQS